MKLNKVAPDFVSRHQEPRHAPPSPAALPGVMPRDRSNQAGVLHGLMNFKSSQAASAHGLFSSARPDAPENVKTPDRKRHEHSVIPDPPFSLRQYLDKDCPKLAQYNSDIERSINKNDLGRYEKMQTDKNFLGMGSSKACFSLTDKSVLLVKEKSGFPIHDELMQLKLLERAGFPVVKVHEAGLIPSRYSSADGIKSKNPAVVQERLSDFYNFERVTPDMQRKFLESPLLNKNTLKSLKVIRNLIHEKGVSIGDLQGGLRSDGTFAIADTTYLARSAEGHVMQKKRMDNLDKLISAVSAKLQT